MLGSTRSTLGAWFTAQWSTNALLRACGFGFALSCCAAAQLPVPVPEPVRRASRFAVRAPLLSLNLLFCAAGSDNARSGALALAHSHRTLQHCTQWLRCGVAKRSSGRSSNSKVGVQGQLVWDGAGPTVLGALLERGRRLMHALLAGALAGVARVAPGASEAVRAGRVVSVASRGATRLRTEAGGSASLRVRRGARSRFGGSAWGGRFASLQRSLAQSREGVW